MRQRRLEELRMRDMRRNDTGNLIVFKCTFTNAVRGLRIHTELRLLVQKLRGEIRQDFLREARVVVGYRIEQNAFLR